MHKTCHKSAHICAFVAGHSGREQAQKCTERRINTQKSAKARHFACKPVDHLQGSQPKKSEKKVSRPLAPPPRVWKKSREGPEKILSRLLPESRGVQGRTAPGDFFQTFSGLRARRARETLPEGPARHLDVSGQKLSPHCLETIFDSQFPSPRSSPKMPPKLSLPDTRGHSFLFQNYPRGESNCETIERQKLSRGNFCPGTSRCLAGPERPL